MAESNASRAFSGIRRPAKAPPKKMHASEYKTSTPAKGLPPKTAPVRRAGQQARPTSDARNKIASSEISNATAAKAHARRVTADEAYAGMKKVRQLDGALSETTWTPKGIATLEACLTALSAWGGNETICNETRYRLKKERGSRRALNTNNPYLVTIHCCHAKPTRAQCSEFSRFSQVVEVAHRQGVAPEEAKVWLTSRTQKAILNEARKLKGKKSAVKETVASKKVRPHIWHAVQAGEGEMFDFAIDQLDKLEKRLASFGGGSL